MAGHLAQAYDAGFARLEQISIWARRPAQAEALCARLSGHGRLRAKVAWVQDARDAAGQADIIATATMAQQPILLGDWVRPGSHIDLIGGFTPEMREADDALVARSLAYADCMETVMDKVGDVIAPLQSGAICRNHIRGDLYDLMALQSPARQSARDITLFKNGGGAHLDLMMACYIAQSAGL